MFLWFQKKLFHIRLLQGLSGRAATARWDGEHPRYDKTVTRGWTGSLGAFFVFIFVSLYCLVYCFKFSLFYVLRNPSCLPFVGLFGSRSNSNFILVVFDLYTMYEMKCPKKLMCRNVLWIHTTPFVELTTPGTVTSLSFPIVIQTLKACV